MYKVRYGAPLVENETIQEKEKTFQPEENVTIQRGAR